MVNLLSFEAHKCATRRRFRKTFGFQPAMRRFGPWLPSAGVPSSAAQHLRLVEPSHVGKEAVPGEPGEFFVPSASHGQEPRGSRAARH